MESEKSDIMLLVFANQKVDFAGKFAVCVLIQGSRDLLVFFFFSFYSLIIMLERESNDFSRRIKE